MESKETAFRETMFRNWKNAFDKNRGFPKYQSTIVYMKVINIWKVKEVQALSSSISTLVSNTTLENNGYYVRRIIEVVLFLAVIELAFKEYYDIDNHTQMIGPVYIVFPTSNKKLGLILRSNNCSSLRDTVEMVLLN